MDYLLAFLPILTVFVLMIIFRIGGQYAGPLAWLVGLGVAVTTFGLTWDVWVVSQLKGLVFSFFVLLVIWPALFLYKLVDGIGGMQALMQALEKIFPQRGMLWIVLAWIFSGLIESLTGFGLPIAIIAPLLVGIGVSPVLAVASVAVGHAWAVAFGSMGNGVQALAAVVQMDAIQFAPFSALLLTIGNLGCGLGVAMILKQGRRWPMVVGFSAVMGTVFYFSARLGFIQLAAFFAGLSGMLAAIAWQHFFMPAEQKNTSKQPASPALKGALAAYGLLIGMILMVGLIPPLQNVLSSVTWAPLFPEVVTTKGFVIKSGIALAFRPLNYAGTFIAVSALACYFLFRRWGLSSRQLWSSAFKTTWQLGMPATISIMAMLGLSTMMEHSGMSLLLARGTSQVMGQVFPVVSPLVGMIGCFITGSNANSNVLFAPLQKGIAQMLNISPFLLVAAQTAGGSLGSMIAPAKLIVSCSTVGIPGRDGEVLRITLPYGLVICLAVGLLTLVLVTAGI